MKKARTRVPGNLGLALPGWKAAMVFGAILLACCARLPALDPALDVSQYAHTAWRVREGFTRGAINSIAQTPDGYLWLGTEFGLFRFDGVRLTPWQPPAGEHPGEDIRNVMAAHDGTLWIGTRTGLASWKDGKFTIYPEMSGQQVAHLLEDHEGTIWAGGFRTPNEAKLCAFHRGGVECHGGDGRLGFGVFSIYEDSKANLWVGVAAGFWRWKPGPPKFFPVGTNSGGIRDFAEDNQGTLVVCMSSGIGRLVDDRIETDVLSRLKPPPKMDRIFRDHDGGLWIGTSDRGMLHAHQGKIDTFSQLDGLSGDDITSILEDREGNIWVATSDGLDRFRPYSVSTLSVKQGLSNSLTGAVLAARDGSVWIVTLIGLDRWQRGNFSLYGLRNGARKPDGKLDGLMPNSLFEDSSGRIWASTVREFGYLDEGRYVTVSGYPGGYVHGIVEGPPGHLWVASQQAGLLHIFQGKVIEQFPWSRLGQEESASAIALDPHGGLWLGFYRGGIAYFADGSIRASYSAANGLGTGEVNQLRFGFNGALFAATEGGVSRIKDGRISTVTTRNGLPCEAVHWTVRDDNGSVWLFTPCGLLRIAQSEWDAWAVDPAKTMKPAVYDPSDGVRTHSVASGFRPLVTKSPDGRLWFITGDGVSILDPHHLVSNKQPPLVQIEQLIADGKSYDPAQGQRMPPLVRNLEIDYTALSLVAPEKVRFRFKLEGQDKDWREVVNLRQVWYSNLPPRHYRFRVMAANNSGVWNELGDSLDFSIAPAYYQTAWFLWLCVVAFLALLYGLYRLRMWQQTLQFNMRLEERVNERTRIARELHDTMLQSFQGVMLKFNSLSYILDRPAEARQRLEALLHQGEQAIAEGRDAVQGIRSSTVIKNDLARALGELGEKLAAEQNAQSPIDFSVAVEGDSRDLHPILRDEVYRIAGEAIRNAFGHSGARRIEVEIHYGDRQLRVRVLDDGKGIDPKVLDGGGRQGHFGLPGMQERAKLAGGKLTVLSKPGSGTEIELTIPAPRAYIRASTTG